MNRQNINLTIYLPEHIMNWYARAANQDRRTLASFLRNALSDMLEGDPVNMNIECFEHHKPYTLRVSQSLIDMIRQEYIMATPNQIARNLLIQYYDKRKTNVWGILTSALATNQTQYPKL